MLSEAAKPLSRLVELPGRGTTRVWECPGPDGAETLMLIHGVAVTAELNWNWSSRRSPGISVLSRPTSAVMAMGSACVRRSGSRIAPTISPRWPRSSISAGSSPSVTPWAAWLLS